MTPEEAHSALDGMLAGAKLYTGQAPVALIALYPGGDYALAGKKGRDREETSKTLIRLAAGELQDAEE